jgi:hypothetical protein
LNHQAESPAVRKSASPSHSLVPNSSKIGYFRRMQPPIRIAHLVNTFVPKAGSEFVHVQPITLASMAAAKAVTGPGVEVTLLSCSLAGEDVPLPEGFLRTEPLTRTVADVVSIPAPPLPLIADLLQRLYTETDAEWLIYTNLDIGLQPHFYEAVAAEIRAGHDALIINRRRIPAHFRRLEELPEMYATTGKAHPGFDCFVFHRDLFPKFSLGLVCIGIPFIEIITAQNLFCHAHNFKLLDRAHLTFHIGEEVYRPRHRLLWLHNQQQFWLAIRRIWPLLDTRRFPWGNWPLPLRVLRWGVHPCIPIRLVLQLEWRQLWRRKS